MTKVIVASLNNQTNCQVFECCQIKDQNFKIVPAQLVNSEYQTNQVSIHADLSLKIDKQSIKNELLPFIQSIHLWNQHIRFSVRFENCQKEFTQNSFETIPVKTVVESLLDYSESDSTFMDFISTTPEQENTPFFKLYGGILIDNYVFDLSKNNFGLRLNLSLFH